MIDETSLRILKILQERARIPNIEVSRLIGMAPSAVLERIRKLENLGYIDGYEVRLNPKRFGHSQVAFIRVLVREVQKYDSSVGDKLAEIPEVQEVHFVAGEDCYLVKIRVSDTVELGRILREKIFPIAGVFSTRTMPVLTTFKETSRIPIRQTITTGGQLTDSSNKQTPYWSNLFILIIHDIGAHGHAMGFNYNGRLRPKELLFRADGSVELIRRAENELDYFATLNFAPETLHF
jgi:Lrp/AsnC family transcriptional regulator, leucine-responsive regulatory protein